METTACMLLAEVVRKAREKKKKELEEAQKWTELEALLKMENAEVTAKRNSAAIMDDARFLILLRIAGGVSTLSPVAMLAVFIYTYESGTVSKMHTFTNGGWQWVYQLCGSLHHIQCAMTHCNLLWAKEAG